MSTAGELPGATTHCDIINLLPQCGLAPTWSTATSIDGNKACLLLQIWYKLEFYPSHQQKSDVFGPPGIYWFLWKSSLHNQHLWPCSGDWPCMRKRWNKLIQKLTRHLKLLAVTLPCVTVSLSWMPHSCTGIPISTNKTKLLVVGRHAATKTAKPVIMLHGEHLEVVSQFMLEAAFQLWLQFRRWCNTQGHCQ